MKAAILYYSREATQTTSQAIWIDNKVRWIRVDIIKVLSLDQALDKAKPEHGEIVLNSVKVR